MRPIGSILLQKQAQESVGGALSGRDEGGLEAAAAPSVATSCLRAGWGNSPRCGAELPPCHWPPWPLSLGGCSQGPVLAASPDIAPEIILYLG